MSWALLATAMFSVTIYAIAEDLTLTTYYPSPRGVYQELRTQGDVGIGNISTAPYARLHVTQTDAATAFLVDDEAGDKTPFAIDEAGNVGIGTPSPVQPLDVNGSILTRKNLYFQTTPGDYVIAIGEMQTLLSDWKGMPVPVDKIFGMGWDSATQQLGIKLPPGAIFKIGGKFEALDGRFVNNLEAAGNVIAQKDVVILRDLVSVRNITSSGNFTTPGDISIGGTIDASGNINAGGMVTAVSDARLKTNVTTLTGALDKLADLRSISFEWNDLHRVPGETPADRHIGVIAQDVEAAFPELVSSWGPEGYKAVDYGGLTAVLLEAIKELRQENATLQQRLELLERRMGAQEDGS